MTPNWNFALEGSPQSLKPSRRKSRRSRLWKIQSVRSRKRDGLKVHWPNSSQNKGSLNANIGVQQALTPQCGSNSIRSIVSVGSQALLTRLGTFSQSETWPTYSLLISTTLNLNIHFHRLNYNICRSIFRSFMQSRAGPLRLLQFCLGGIVGCNIKDR